jgi:uncharacterized membrane protein YozB (DUF420 family)
MIYLKNKGFIFVKADAGGREFMFEQFIYDASILGGDGFLGTRASFSLDLLISFLAFLPISVAISILFVTKGYLKIHQFFQILLFLLTVSFLAWFAYIVHYKEGLALLLEQSSVPSSQVYLYLGIHILLSIIVIFKWFFSIVYALSDRRRRALPGLYSQAHIKSGKSTFLFIFLIALSSVGVYWALFVA